MNSSSTKPNWSTAKAVLANVSVVSASMAIGVMICEVGARLMLHPADYLSVEMIEDKILGATPSSPTMRGGFDAWGFRNPTVPKSVEIVSLGDSHTYGNTARMEDAWPAVLAQRTGKSVYNMGLGGYGPNQYHYLLTSRALSLKPKIIICGLYLGDDFENAFLITYGLDHWKKLRELPASDVNFDIWEAPETPNWHRSARIWLSRHSVFYQLVFHGPLIGRFQGEFQIKNAAKLYPGATTLNLGDKGILEAFRPTGILRRLNQASPTVQEGMRITFKLLQEMKELCRKNDVQFLVVIIPTKELVFAPFIEHNTLLPLSHVLDQVISNERIALAKTAEALNNAGIPFVDTLPALSAAVGKQLYVRTAADMHPSKNGYRVIGETVASSAQLSRISWK